MKIKRLKIHNWRSIKDVDIQMGNLMVFLGQNNHGKSNILSALLFFFGEIKHSELDFNNDSDDLYVEITFNDLDEYDKKIFEKYITDANEFCVRKTGKIDGSSFYNGYIETPDEEWLIGENAGNYTSREAAKDLPFYDHLPKSGRITKAHIIEAQKKYIEENKKSLEIKYNLESTYFMGKKNITKGLFGEIFYIPSVKEASDELNTKNNSVFNQLYSRAINSMSENNIEYKEAKKKIYYLVDTLNKIDSNGNLNTRRPEQLTNLERLLEQELSHWNANLYVEITPPNIDDIFKLGTNVWIDDGCKTDIRHKGHGLQRALIFALIRSLARINSTEESAATSDNGDYTPTTQKSQSSFFIIEEPELYLHPQAQRQSFKSLLDLANNGNQVILCTHSSSFISLEYYKSICIVRKESQQIGTKTHQCLDELFENKNQKAQFNLMYWINPDRSELFFAKKVILVEGPTDKTIIPLLANKLNCYQYDYTIIDCGAKNSIPSYINLLNKFHIPYVAVYDKDHQPGKNQNDINKADKISAKIENTVDRQLGTTVVFVNDIEEELGLSSNGSKSKPYIALKHVSSDKFNITKSLEDKIRKIYS